MNARRLGSRTMAAVAAAMLLSACWSGPALFTARDATPRVIEDGIYMIDEPGSRELAEAGPEEGLKVVNQADGSMRVTAGDNNRYDMRVLAVSVSAPADRRFVLQVTTFGERDDRYASYALLDARTKPARATLLRCDRDTQRLATASGGSVSRDPNTMAACDFTDRNVLLSQLKRVAAMEMASRDVVELTPYRP